MDDTLKGIPMVCCRIDDILIGSPTEEEHLILVNEVVSRLEERGFSCSLEKSVFMSDKLIYLGHEVTQEGTKPMKKKMDAWLEAPAPKNVSELVSFLGAVNYYRKYLPDLATVIQPLERLRQKETLWKWGDEERESYGKLRKMLMSDRVLMFYNDKLPVIVETDASEVGLGGVLSHRCANGDVRPVEFISRTLSKAESNYSQIEKEALAIVWALKRLYMYVYGREFELVTDHKPLTCIYHEDKGIGKMAASRLTRWGVFLMEYNYKIRYRPTKEHANCDALSRLPVEKKSSQRSNQVSEVSNLSVMEEVEIEINTVKEWDHYLCETFINVEVIKKAGKRDKILQQVIDFQVNGWPNQVTEQFQVFYRKKEELSVENDCLLWGVRTYVPSKLREQVLNLLHLTHVGMVGMKRLARAYVWWPNIDTDIEEKARTCAECGRTGKVLPKVIDHPWVRPSGPFQRVHMDFTGPYMGKSWLVLVCGYSKWVEVIPFTGTSSAEIIKQLRNIFSRTGIPNCIVTDNGQNFCSHEIEEFFTENGVRHVQLATFSSASNGQVERMNQTLKLALKRMSANKKTLEHNLASFLLFYRNIPHPSTGETPSKLMYGRALRSQLSSLKTMDHQILRQLDNDTARQEKIEGGNFREFSEGQLVWVNLQPGRHFEEGVVLEREGEVLYKVNVNGRHVLKHVNTLKGRTEKIVEMAEKEETVQREVTEVSNDQQTEKGEKLPVETVPVETVPVETVPARRSHGEKWRYLSEEGVRRSSRLSGDTER